MHDHKVSVPSRNILGGVLFQGKSDQGAIQEKPFFTFGVSAEVNMFV